MKQIVLTEEQINFLKKENLLTEEVKRVKNGIIYHGEKFPGYNKPKSYIKGTHGTANKKKRVLAKQGDKVKIVNYGDRGYSDFTKHKNPKRRSNFRSRHNCKTAKDKLTARYWACKDLW